MHVTRQPTPTTVKRLGREAIEIVWNDGHRGVYPNRYLRDNCPCASCREGKPKLSLPVVGDGELYAVQIGVVGRYALSIQWSDGHDTGIYSYDTVRQLCPCEQCQGASEPPAGEDTTVGSPTGDRSAS
jgi:DUF971 family protein